MGTSVSGIIHDKELYIRLFGYLKPYKNRFIIGLLATVPAASLNGVLAFMIGPFIDKMLNSHQYTILFLVPLAILGASLLQGVCDYISSYYTTYVGTSVSQDIRLELYKHLSRMDQRYINLSSPGDLLTRYYSDPSRLQLAIVNHLQTFILESFTAFFLAAVLFYRSWQFALVALAIISLIFIPIRLISQKLRRLDNQTQEIMGMIYDVFNESVYASKVITIFGLKNYQLKRFEKGLHEYFGVSMRLTRADSILKPVMQMITAAGVSLIILFGSIQVQKGLMTPGDMTSFLVALVLLYKPIKNVGTILGKIQRIFAPAERVFEKLDIKPDIQEPETPVLVEQFESLAFENVHFAYTPDKPVLKDISFTVKAGETIALVGESGGGKSTLVDLIPRFMDPTQGRILLNGHDLKSLSLSSLWRLFAIVTQETMLFDGTIRENIRLGKLTATEEEIDQALKAANLKEFITSLPAGLDTPVGTRGVMLSGGQKQRIAIARAFLKDAPIVILDEATSALDNESEAVVQEAMMNVMAGKTVIVIAHRLSTIRFADRILVMSDGRIVETGTHEALLQMQGIYNKLYYLQFRHDNEFLEHLQASAAASGTL